MAPTDITTPATITIDGEVYNVVHVFNPLRVLIDYDGLYAIADGHSDGSWGLTGMPADAEEGVIVKQFAATVKTDVEVFDPDGNKVDPSTLSSDDLTEVDE